MTQTSLKDLIASEGLSLQHVDAPHTNAVIVALPAAMDPIRLIGDEDKHATLMYFGETATLPEGAKEELLSTVEVVSKMSMPFGERVVDISRLGSENPPALVAMLSNRCLEKIRNTFTVNPAVAGYLTNTEQFPTFTPHVTLGYPDYAGEAEIRPMAKQVRYVQFDRLAVWWNGEQFEFPLSQYHDRMDDEAAWADDLADSYSAQLQLDDFLAHYGVKGMRWGVVRQLKGMAPGDRDAFIKTKDAKWLAKVEANPKLSKISRVAARDATRQTKKLKADYKAQGLNIKKDSLARTRYDTELKGILENSLDKASYRVHKFSPSRLSEVAIHRHPDGSITAMVRPRTNLKIVKQQGKIARADYKRTKAENKAAKKAMQHADILVEDAADDFDGMEFLLVQDEEGFVTEVRSTVGDDEMAQAEEMVDDFLAHFGVGELTKGNELVHSEGGDSMFMSHASESDIKKKLDSMKSKYGEKFFTMPLMNYVMEQPESRRVRIMRSIVADVAQLKVLSSMQSDSAAHADWSEALVSRDGLGQFSSKAAAGLIVPDINDVKGFGSWLYENVGHTATTRDSYQIDTDGDGIADTFGYSETETKYDFGGNVVSESTSTQEFPTSETVSSSERAPASAGITDLIPDPTVISYASSMWSKFKHSDLGITHDELETLDDFLAHYGVKGMRWGVRRSDDDLDGGSSSKTSRFRRARKPSDNADTDGDGEPDTRLSADAERIMNTLSKESHEMSTREMKEAVERANQIKKYKEVFEQDELAGAVDRLRLEKDYRNLKAELYPEQRTAAQKLIAASKAGFEGYKKVDDVMGGKLTEALKAKTGLEKVPSKSEIDKLTESTSVLKAQKDNLVAAKELDALMPKPPPTVKPTVAQAYNNYAKAAVKDAKDLNNLVDDYLGPIRQPKSDGVSPGVGSGYYITKDGRFVSTTPKRK